MSLIEIKNSTETFASIDDPTGKVKLNTKNKVIDDFITIQANIQTETKTATANGTITPTSGKYLSSVTVAIPEWTGDIYLSQIGGRIFYDDGDNGATYTFYDANNNVVNYDGTIASLANATQYTVSGTPTKDRWYVYDNTTGLISYKAWGKYGTTTGLTADTIGSGKTNTAAMMNMSPDGTMWTWLRDTINGGNVGGCNDWFIASKAEQDKLRESGLVDWYSSKFVWSSVEDGSYVAYYWDFGGSLWDYGNKNLDFGACFAARAF